MASLITDADIQREALGQQVRNLLAKINDGTATATDVHASNISLPEKDVCLSLVAATATRQQIMASATLPPFKHAALKMAGFSL